MSAQGTSKKFAEGEDIEREANKLLRKNLENKRPTDVLLSELRSKYKDEDIVENLRSNYTEIIQGMWQGGDDEFEF